VKTLLILRHAKSSWKRPVDDHERPLNRRGKSDAPRMGRLLRERGLVPERIVSSTARRARKTAARVAKAAGYTGEIELSADLYLAGPEGCQRALRRIPDDPACVLVIGHNPGLEMFLDGLTGREERLPTAALVQVRLDVDRWEEVDGGTRGELVGLWRPRELRGGGAGGVQRRSPEPK